MSLLNLYVEQSPFKKSWLSRACHISSPSRFSKLTHGAALPTAYELRLLDIAFSRLKICSQSQLLEAVQQNAERLKREIDLDAVFGAGPTPTTTRPTAKKKKKKQ